MCGENVKNTNTLDLKLAVAFVAPDLDRCVTPSMPVLLVETRSASSFVVQHHA